MRIRIMTVLLVAAAMLGSCKSNQRVGVLTKPTSATSNLEGHEYPKINPDLSATFRNDFPDAKTVTVNVGGKNYPLVKGDDGIWEVTTDPLVVGFHYYTMNVDGKRHVEAEEIKKNLILQLTSSVRWTLEVQNMMADGATSFTECGPGKALQGMIVKIAREAGKEVVLKGVEE